MQILAAKNPGDYRYNQWLYPNLEDAGKGLGTVAKMRRHFEKEAKFTPPPYIDQSDLAQRQRRENAARDAARSSPNVTPSSVVSAAGEEAKEKKKKKEKKQGMGAGVSGAGITSILGSSSVTIPSLLGS
jgi:hypothetical protein